MAAFEGAEEAAKVEMMRHCASDEVPETLRVIELGEMAELVDDDVVRYLGRQIDDLVVEIEIAFCRAASPPRFVVLDKNLSHTETIRGIEVPDALVYESACALAHAQILLSIAPPQDHA